METSSSINFELPRSDDGASAAAERTLAAVEDVQDQNPEFFVGTDIEQEANAILAG